MNQINVHRVKDDEGLTIFLPRRIKGKTCITHCTLIVSDRNNDVIFNKKLSQ